LRKRTEKRAFRSCNHNFFTAFDLLCRRGWGTKCFLKFVIQGTFRIATLTVLLLLSFTIGAPAEDKDETGDQQPAASDKATEIAKEAQDPLSGLILMPVQYTYTSNIKPLGKPVQITLIQPTFPIDINDKWKIITHTLIPYVSVPEIIGNKTSSGLGNITFQALLSKKTKGKFVWGFGGSLMLPTASNTEPLSWTNTPTGYDSWAAGPSVLGVYRDGPWVAGALFNQMWSFASAAGISLNTLQIQPFVFYNLGKGYSFGYTPIISINWGKSASQSTMLPVGLQFGKLFMIGGVFPLGLSVGASYNIIHPDYTPESSVGAQLFFVLPESIF
jgi:hypothetical protein